MSRSSHGAVNAGSAGGRGRLALAIGAGGLPRAPRRAGGERRRGDHVENDGGPRQHRDDAGPVLPRVALPGDRQRHRLPGQHRPGIAALPRPQERQDQVLDADPLRSRPAASAPSSTASSARRPRRAWRSCAASPAPTRPATTCAPRARSTCSAPTSARRSSSAPRCKVQKDDIVGLTVPTWAPAFAQGLPANNAWRASREPGKCINSTDVRQGEPQQKVGTPRHLRLPLLHRPPALHGHRRRGLKQRAPPEAPGVVAAARP